MFGHSVCLLVCYTDGSVPRIAKPIAADSASDGTKYLDIGLGDGTFSLCSLGSKPRSKIKPGILDDCNSSRVSGVFDEVLVYD